ncbi:uncharacterized protein G2W53_018528 [Senna tora]|uniref:Uncharacterized protein n=1 Tax=Senna tora TaxID=362788 RepID=A0A834TTA0_9FABA|nr:uncharacterized protein G2W53_018528 [Senna tora]
MEPSKVKMAINGPVSIESHAEY